MNAIAPLMTKDRVGHFEQLTELTWEFIFFERQVLILNEDYDEPVSFERKFGGIVDGANIQLLFPIQYSVLRDKTLSKNSILWTYRITEYDKLKLEERYVEVRSTSGYTGVISIVFLLVKLVDRITLFTDNEFKVNEYAKNQTKRDNCENLKSDIVGYDGFSAIMFYGIRNYSILNYILLNLYVCVNKISAS